MHEHTTVKFYKLFVYKMTKPKNLIKIFNRYIPLLLFYNLNYGFIGFQIYKYFLKLNLQKNKTVNSNMSIPHFFDFSLFAANTSPGVGYGLC